MLTIVGGKRKSIKNRSYKKNKRGGCGSWSNKLSPADFTSLDNTLPGGANFEAMPNKFSTTQVGGEGYGFSSANLKDVATFGGNYAPTSVYKEEGAFGNRGGNNFGMAGGKKRSVKHKHKHSAKHKHKHSANCQHSAKKGGKHKHKHSAKHKHSSKKWRQKGCKGH